MDLSEMVEGGGLLDDAVEVWWGCYGQGVGEHQSSVHCYRDLSVFRMLLVKVKTKGLFSARLLAGPTGP